MKFRVARGYANGHLFPNNFVNFGLHFREQQLSTVMSRTLMAALSNIGGALCKTSVIPFLVPRRKVWLTPTAGVLCSNAANIGERKTWTQSEFCTWQNAVRGQEPPKMYI